MYSVYLTSSSSSKQAMQKLTDALHKDRLSESSLLKVYWPQSKCDLLQEDVELVDWLARACTPAHCYGDLLLLW